MPQRPQRGIFCLGSSRPLRRCCEFFCLAFVCLCEIPVVLSRRSLRDLALKLPVAANGLVLIERRVQLFDGDITGYSQQKVRPIWDVNIGTVPIDCLPNAGVVQIRVLSASQTLGTQRVEHACGNADQMVTDVKGPMVAR